MEDILRQNNLSLLRDIERLRGMLQARLPELPSEWHGWLSWTLGECRNLHKRLERNLRDLDHHQTSIHPDVLSQTQAVTREFQRLSRQASPVMRGSAEDRVALRVLLWLHKGHADTKDIPVAVSNEDFSVWPVNPTMYLLPWTVQHGLLYLPLFFHEFGHLLYALHHPEMDALVKELQETIAELVAPLSQMDDGMAAQVMEEQTFVVERWYEWMQEFFCDAVGLTIGGNAYVRSFSTYLRMRGRDQFSIPKEGLAFQAHPVTWLRIRMLARRLRDNGSVLVADALEAEWGRLAGAMKVSEDYFGFYADEFLEPVQRTLTDMLVETGPVGLDHPAIEASAAGGYSNPVGLLIEAWERFLKSPDTYDGWEQKAVSGLLSGVAVEGGG